MAAQVEMKSGQGETAGVSSGHLRRTAEPPSGTQGHVTLGLQAGKPATCTKPLLTPKPFSLEKTLFIRPILPPKPQVPTAPAGASQTSDQKSSELSLADSPGVLGGDQTRSTKSNTPTAPKPALLRNPEINPPTVVIHDLSSTLQSNLLWNSKSDLLSKPKLDPTESSISVPLNAPKANLSTIPKPDDPSTPKPTPPHTPKLDLSSVLKPVPVSTPNLSKSEVFASPEPLANQATSIDSPEKPRKLSVLERIKMLSQFRNSQESSASGMTQNEQQPRERGAGNQKMGVPISRAKSMGSLDLARWEASKDVTEEEQTRGEKSSVSPPLRRNTSVVFQPATPQSAGSPHKVAAPRKTGATGQLSQLASRFESLNTPDKCQPDKGNIPERKGKEARCVEEATESQPSENTEDSLRQMMPEGRTHQESKKQGTDQEEAASSIKKRISLLFDPSFAQGGGVSTPLEVEPHSSAQPIQEVDISVGVKQRIKQLIAESPSQSPTLRKVKPRPLSQDLTKCFSPGMSMDTSPSVGLERVQMRGVDKKGREAHEKVEDPMVDSSIKGLDQSGASLTTLDQSANGGTELEVQEPQSNKENAPVETPENAVPIIPSLQLGHLDRSAVSEGILGAQLEEKASKREEEIQKQLEQERKWEEEKQLELEKKREEERQKQLELEKKREEERQKQLELEKKREEERQKQLVLEKKQEEERQKQLEQEKKLEEERQKQLELEKKREEERQKQLEQEKKWEEERQKQLELERKQEEERQKQLELERKREEERQKQLELEKKWEEERQKQLELEKKREDERQKQLELERKREEERQKQLELERKREEERQKQLELERKREEERQKQLELDRKNQEREVEEAPQQICTAGEVLPTSRASSSTLTEQSVREGDENATTEEIIFDDFSVKPMRWRYMRKSSLLYGNTTHTSQTQADSYDEGGEKENYVENLKDQEQQGEIREDNESLQKKIKTGIDQEHDGQGGVKQEDTKSQGGAEILDPIKQPSNRSSHLSPGEKLEAEEDRCSAPRKTATQPLPKPATCIARALAGNGPREDDGMQDKLLSKEDDHYGSLDTAQHPGEDSPTPTTTPTDALLEPGTPSELPSPSAVSPSAVSSMSWEATDPLPFPETPTSLLDSSALRSRVQLGKRRSQRAPPSRAARQKAAQDAKDPQFQDSAGTRSEMTAQEDVEDEEEEEEEEEEKVKMKTEPCSTPLQPQRVAVFPGLDPSALKAQLKKRAGDSENQAEQLPPQRSAKSPFLPQATRVLPPVTDKENREHSSPQWLQELKSKKRFSQHESDT
nr:histone-lysine N-methyltransferase, H3 lysine-79 specific-like [Paramormyrops kingsleyae]XP_023664182.1 histone-lysine N-methyltransferase, H3 lysine-79 specific-like [Paramormyrops kingsleyae]